jgi:hypothetical protein
MHQGRSIINTTQINEVHPSSPPPPKVSDHVGHFPSVDTLSILEALVSIARFIPLRRQRRLPRSPPDPAPPHDKDGKCRPIQPPHHGSH